VGSCLVAGWSMVVGARVRGVAARAKMARLSTLVVVVGVLAGSKLVVAPMVLGLELLGMVVGVLVLGDAVVCIATGACTPSGLSRKTTFWNLMCSIDRLLKGGLRVYLERVFNICASLSSLARVALFCNRC
jgi:hypothetical protein